MSYMNIVKNCGYAYYNEKYYQRKAIHRINKNSEEKADWRKHIEKNMTTCNPMVNNNKVNVWEEDRKMCNKVKGLAQVSEDLMEILYKKIKKKKHGSQKVCYEKLKDIHD